MTTVTKPEQTQIDNANASAPFLDSHLELVAGVGPIAAMALENARRWESLKEENERLEALTGHRAPIDRRE